MDQHSPDAEQASYAALLRAACQHAAATLADIDDRPVARGAPAPDLPPLPTIGHGTAATLELFMQQVAPHLSASAGPRYLGFVTGGVTPAALVGDWLTSVFDQNAISSLDGAAALHLEHTTLAMLGELMGLPAELRGTLVSGATMANLVGLAIARQWCAAQAGHDAAEHGTAGQPVVPHVAGAAHASVAKALAILGIGRRALVPVGCLPGREAIDIAALEQFLEQHPGPVVIVASAGTVNTGDFDDLAALVRLRERYGCWLHIDAAFGAFAALSPEHAALLAGWQDADSIAFDLHKWLNVPYDAGVVFTRHRRLQPEVFSSAAAYLVPADDPEPLHLAPENSHRWRALPAWFSLMAYGRAGYRTIVVRCCRHARALAAWIGASDAYELLAPVRLNIVCFAPRCADAVMPVILAVRDRGLTFVTPTVVRGRPAIRAAFASWRTRDSDLALIITALAEAAAARGVPPNTDDGAGP
ncbi:MAG: aspartate aminotransferase family protein [Chloroflexi bacterium]|nr:aspartate aminotransferase family protein [Chloroflexota bacterium]